MPQEVEMPAPVKAIMVPAVLICTGSSMAAHDSAGKHT
jgi:hypothetical protein